MHSFQRFDYFSELSELGPWDLMSHLVLLSGEGNRKKTVKVAGLQNFLRGTSKHLIPQAFNFLWILILISYWEPLKN